MTAISDLEVQQVETKGHLWHFKYGVEGCDEPIIVAGARAAVRPRADDARYLDTTIAARDSGGRVVASAAITFVAVRGAARRLAAGMLAVNPPELLRRVFPGYAR